MPALFGRRQVLQNHALFQKKRQLGEPTKKATRELRPRMALVRWLFSPAGIGHRRRPS
jgi:hypothetical protein